MQWPASGVSKCNRTPDPYASTCNHGGLMRSWPPGLDLGKLPQAGLYTSRDNLCEEQFRRNRFYLREDLLFLTRDKQFFP